MGVLVAAVVVLTALTLFNLVLTMALVRRLRRLEDPGRGGTFPEFPDLEEVPAGRPVPDFTATTRDGVEISAKERLGDRAVYAFFDTSCGTCKKQLQPLVDFARRAGLADADAYTSVLEGHATIVMQSLGDEVGLAFSPGGIPAVILADADGVVVRSGVEVRSVAAAFLEA